MRHRRLQNLRRCYHRDHRSQKDSIWIADLHKHGLIPGSFIPPADIRDLLRYRSKLVSFASSEKKRVQNSLTVSNIMLSSLVSDTFGKSSSAIHSHSALVILSEIGADMTVFHSAKHLCSWAGLAPPTIKVPARKNRFALAVLAFPSSPYLFSVPMQLLRIKTSRNYSTLNYNSLFKQKREL